MTDNGVTLSREQVSEVFKALCGISNLLKGLTSTRGNAFAVYAIMSNLAVIQANLTGIPHVNSN
jgi:hypothetical protein